MPLGPAVPFAADILIDAEAACREGLLQSPDRADLLHLTGLLAARTSRWPLAIGCLSRAVEKCSPHDAAQYRLDLADALLSAGRRREAHEEFVRVQALAPEDPRPYRGAGRALIQLGRLDEALAALSEALRLAPDHAQTLAALGDVHAARGDWPRALDAYTKRLALAPDNAQAYCKIGDVHVAIGALDDAERSFRAALAMDYKCAPALVGLGLIALRRGRMEDALGAFRSAIAADPNNLQACQRFLQVAELLGRTDDAASGWYRLGIALDARQQLDDTQAAFEQGARRQPRSVPTLLRLGYACIARNNDAQALRVFDSVLEIVPDNRLARSGAGAAAHRLHDLRRGWREFRWYQREDSEEAGDFEQPLWDGSPLNGKTILLWADWALGDTIQFARFVPLVKALGGRIILECPKVLVPLMRSIPGVDQVLGKPAPLPPFDLHAPLLSLPRIFDAGEDDLPRAVPYLSVDPGLVERWKHTLGRTRDMTVGLSWAGQPGRTNSSSRFMTLSTLAPLGRVKGVRFISLQQGAGAIDIVAPPAELAIETFPNDTRTVADTAALMMNLDLVITVDTMVAHLSGALAKPTWTLLSHSPSWQWGSWKDSLPWYPTMRLFRQPRAGDWRDLMERVADSLTQLIQHRAPREAP